MSIKHLDRATVLRRCPPEVAQTVDRLYDVLDSLGPSLERAIKLVGVRVVAGKVQFELRPNPQARNDPRLWSIQRRAMEAVRGAERLATSEYQASLKPGRKEKATRPAAPVDSAAALSKAIARSGKRRRSSSRLA